MDYPYIKLMNPELQLLGQIDIYTALDYRRSWQGTGDFLLQVTDFKPLLYRPGNVLMLGNDPHKAGIIRTVAPVSNGYGTVTAISGQTLNGLTSQRCVLPVEGNSGYFSVPLQSENRTAHAEEIVKTIIDSCLGPGALDVKRRLRINGQQLLAIAANQNRGISTEWGCRYPQLDEELQAICEYCDCGYEIYIDFDNHQYIAEYLPGMDRTVGNASGNSPVIFSIDFESVEKVEYSEDISEYHNLGYCGGKGSGESRTVISVTNETEFPSGFDRREVFLDCGELDNVETDTAMSLSVVGKHKLEEYNYIKNLTADISQGGSFRYGEHWDIGDLVTIRDINLNLTQDVRITEVCESYEPHGYKLTVSLGKPPKNINRAIRNIRNEVR